MIYDLNLKESLSAYKRLEGVYNRIELISGKGNQSPEELTTAIASCNKEFSKAMNDDFNTRDALAALFQFSRLVNRYDLNLLTADLQKSLLDLFNNLGKEVLGLFVKDAIDPDFESQVEKLIAQGKAARCKRLGAIRYHTR